MPVSKRDKKVSLTKTTKKGMALKQQLVEDIRQFLNKYDNLFVFTIHNMRNGPLKDLREDWKDSRFFFAKRKVMAIALGRTEADEMQKNIHKVASHLVGQCGLLFTNRPKNQVVEWFKDFSKMEFAKSGFVATETITLPAGPLPEFSFSLEPHLRSLGLPTQLEKGKIILRQDHTVCTEGVKLTPEQASILKLLGKQMAEFKVKIICMWSKDGSFERFKVPKAAKQLTSEKNTQSQKKNKKGSGNKTEREIAQLFDQQNSIQNVETEESTVPKSTKKQTKKAAPVENTDEDMNDESEKLLQIEEVKETTNTKSNKKKPQKAPKSETDEEAQIESFEQITLNEKSPKITKETPRRSMRTPKPIKRTPEDKKQSVKKLTESNKKKSAMKDTLTKPARGTPRKSVGKRIFEESEDVEMA